MNFFAKLLGRARTSTPGVAATRPGHDASTDIAGTIDRALNAAGLTQRDGSGADVRATIDRALAQAGLASSPAGGGGVSQQAQAAARARIMDAPVTPTTRGEWITRSYSNDAGTLGYKLYVPADHASLAGTQVPLVVMLHGCTQSPDDFAAGTRMNQLADAHGFLVAYPAQTAKANGSKCWNWFRAGDQVHGRGEPSLIAGMVQHVASDYRVDPRRVFVAGLSAGAAMAVILGRTYPEVFAAVGAHSGLPFAAAHDVPSAFAAMKSGPAHAAARKPPATTVPTIVFHGDADHTVGAVNGRAIIREAIAGAATPIVHAGIAPGGRSYTQEVFADAMGLQRVELWTLHGAGHAWSGGSAQGTYTDPAGPDASTEMLRFFLQRAIVARG